MGAVGEAVAVYVHSPFCLSKCGYCDFSSYAMRGEIVERTVEATIAEIGRTPWRGRPAKTVFFGGGTPTFLSERQLLGILETVLEAHPPLSGAEISSEANPGTADAAKFAAMRAAGFNRLSIGAQSFCDNDLKTLGRVHSSSEIGESVDVARRAGFQNINLDLMFALPGQSLEAWITNCRSAVELETEHLSLYCLTIEPSTPFHRLYISGQLQQPDEESQVTMYDACVDTLAEVGVAQYEISNFARRGRECGHNLCYWRGEEYVAYGPGAVGAVATAAGPRVRYTNLKLPSAYCEAMEAGGELWEEREELDESIQRTERIMLGIRLNEGIDGERERLNGEAVGRLEASGLVERDGARVRLTRRGRHYCTDVAAELI
jgi:oxygen-independent coproporphyrinogen-3 oxidase